MKINLATTILFLALTTLQLQNLFSNVPGGGTGTGSDVTVTDNGTALVMNNGVVSISITKTNARITNFSYNGTNLLAGGYGGGSFYWSWNMPTFGGPVGTSSISVNPSTTNGDYAEVRIRHRWTGNAADPAIDCDVYYTLTRGAQGYYATASLSHPASYPANPGGEWRCNTYVGSIFDWLTVDDRRNRLVASRSDLDASVVVTGAPKEVTQLTTGMYKGEYECKYGYAADLGDLDTWGWSSTSRKMGIWMTIPSHEYYNGGPMKTELMSHPGHAMLNMLGGGHFDIGKRFDMAAGEAYQKTFGPFLVYANTFKGAANASASTVANALWEDAKEQAKAEQTAWPYTWFKNPVYVLESGRGAVSGTFRINDADNPNASAEGMWIGLAPEHNGINFQDQAKTYQYWVKTGPDGKFTIPHVIAGTYNLWCFGKGAPGTFKQVGVRVTAGQTLGLNTVTWNTPRTAPTVWEIGIPDRDSKEFRNGAYNYTLWKTSYEGNYEFPNGLTYTIGRSDWKKDWNYTQINAAPWTINFTLNNAPAAGSIASLYIGLASSETTINARVNGTQVGTFRHPGPCHAVIRLGSHGPFADTRFAIPANLLKKGVNTIVLSQGNGTTEYDYLRLEASGTGTVAGIEEDHEAPDQSQVQVYPNPFSHALNIQVNGSFTYTVYNVAGMEAVTGIGENQVTLGATIPAGMYMIKIQTTSGTRFVKVSKEQ